jgi:hypothetical protein
MANSKKKQLSNAEQVELDQKKSEQKKANNKKYRLQNLEKTKAYNKQYRLQNLEKIKADKKVYNLKNSEKITAYNKEYHSLNIEKVKAHNKNYYLQNIEKKKQYQLKNSERIKIWYNKYEKQRRQIDPMYCVIQNLRRRIRHQCHAIKLEKNFVTIEALGCNTLEFKQHIQGKFQDGMTWDNYGKNGWEVDHIKPISLATTLEEVHLLNHYTNLQPLWGPDNWKKSNKYTELSI